MSLSERILNDKLRAAITAYFPRYPTRQAVVLPALHIVNESLGYVPPQAVIEIAELLDLAPSQVHDTLTFYGVFPQVEPAGRYRVWMCRSLSCSACEGESLIEYLAQRLKIQPGQTTEDGLITLLPAECLGACDYAPAMLVNNELHKNMTREKIDLFLEMLRSGDGEADHGTSPL